MIYHIVWSQRYALALAFVSWTQISPFNSIRWPFQACHSSTHHIARCVYLHHSRPFLPWYSHSVVSRCESSAFAKSPIRSARGSSGLTSICSHVNSSAQTEASWRSSINFSAERNSDQHSLSSPRLSLRIFRRSCNDQSWLLVAGGDMIRAALCTRRAKSGTSSIFFTNLLHPMKVTKNGRRTWSWTVFGNDALDRIFVVASCSSLEIGIVVFTHGRYFQSSCLAKAGGCWGLRSWR